MKSHIDWPTRQPALIVILAILGILAMTQPMLIQSSQASTPRQAHPEQLRQQSISVLPIADTYIAQGAPERRRPDLRVMWVGYNQAQGSLEQRSLLRFDLASLPQGAQITSAQLALTLSSTTSNDAPLAISVREIQGAWAEEINWQEMAAAIANGTIVVGNNVATAAIGTSFTQYEWDVTTLVQAWQSGSRSGEVQASTNQASPSHAIASQGTIGEIGFLLQGEATTSERERAFWSRNCDNSDCGASPGKRPLLTITFEEPTPTPEPQPTASPTPLPVEPSPDLNVSLTYQRGSDAPTSHIPADWQEGEALDVRVRIERLHNNQTVNGVNLSSMLPAGVEFVSAGAMGELDEDTGVIEWTNLTIPGNSALNLSYRMQKPVPITNPDIEIDVTAASTIVIFDAAVEKGSNLNVIWEFGDGSPSLARPGDFVQTLAVQHNYGDPGEYMVKMHIYNAACKLTVSETFTLSSPEQQNSLAEDGSASTESGVTSIDSEGTALLPLCPDSIIPEEPFTVLRWDESGEARTRFVNGEGLYLPMLVSR